MVNKYIYSECIDGAWPEIKVYLSRSYKDCVNAIISEYGVAFEDDDILNLETFDELQELLNDRYMIVISQLYEVDEL